MMNCCDPCPNCGAEVDLDEVQMAEDDWGWAHWCSKNCGWHDWMGRDPEEYMELLND